MNKEELEKIATDIAKLNPSLIRGFLEDLA